MLQQKPVESILCSVNWPTMMREIFLSYFFKGSSNAALIPSSFWYYKGRKNGTTVIIVQPDHIQTFLWHKSTLEVLQHQFHGNELYEKALLHLRKRGQSLLK